MTGRNETYLRLGQQFRHSTCEAGILEHLAELEDLVQSGELALGDAYDLRADAFYALKDITVDDPDKAERLILKHLLPYCLERTANADPKLRRASHRCRQCLAEWLNQYLETERAILRDQVLDRLSLSLKEPDPNGARWTVETIGFRRQDVVEALWELVERHDDQTGDGALYTLTALGVPSSERTRILSALHQRAATRYNVSLLAALRRLADPSSLDVARQHWLRPDETDSWPRRGSLALRLLIDIADGAYATPELQDDVWQAVSNLVEKYPDVFSHDLHLGSDTAPRCDSRYVVQTLLKLLIEEDQTTERADYRRYLACLRLTECVRPRQLEGWRTVHEPTAIALLQRDACRDTGFESTALTQQDQLKEIAWDTLLCMRCLEVLTWFEEGIAGETDRLLRRRISERLACLRISPLPSTLLRWVTEPYDWQQGDGSREWASRMAAIRMAHSAASREAFEALCEFGFTYQGEILQQSVDALADVAIELVKAGETWVSEKLVELTIGGQEPRYRTVAAGALEILAAEDLLPKHYAPLLVELVRDEERSPHERSVLVATLGYLRAKVTLYIMGLLVSWAQERDDWLGGRSLETMARLDCLISQPHLLIERLGLQKVDGKWDLASKSRRIEWSAFIIGLLYLQHPSKLMPAVVSLLQTQDWHSAVQVVNLLCCAYGKPDQPPVPPEIRKALLERAGKQQTRIFAETDIFGVLAHLLPDALAQQPWDQMWSEWLPDARRALADALGEAVYVEPQVRNRAVSLLLLLTRDGQYAVRRAAYRGITHQSPISLETACIAWSRSDVMELRQRAAEASVWLKPKGHLDVFHGLYQQLSADPEAPVRETAERARRERCERLWADEYLSHILEVEGRSNEEILSAWCYGQALARIGDDECMRKLRAHISTRSRPPNVRHWIQKIVDDMDRNWRKVTQKWPEPWIALEGAIEEGEGSIESSRAAAVRVRYSLWERPSPTPSGKHSWGGVAWTASDDLLTVDLHEFALHLEDGRQGAALVQQRLGPVVIFHGQGSYPR